MSRMIVTLILILLLLGCIVYTMYAVYSAIEAAFPALFGSSKQAEIDRMIAREQEMQNEISLLQLQVASLREENRRMELQLQIERAKSDLELAQGQRSILEASARTVETNRWLVAWNAVRGDVIVILVLAFLLASVVLGAAFGMSIYIRMRRRDTKMEIILPTYKVR